jgi:hypothetical protein
MVNGRSRFRVKNTPFDSPRTRRYRQSYRRAWERRAGLLSVDPGHRGLAAAIGERSWQALQRSDGIDGSFTERSDGIHRRFDGITTLPSRRCRGAAGSISPSDHAARRTAARRCLSCVPCPVRAAAPCRGPSCDCGGWRCAIALHRIASDQEVLGGSASSARLLPDRADRAPGGQ